MYYESEIPTGTGSPSAPDVNVSVTPSVALRALDGELRTYAAKTLVIWAYDIFGHFVGPVQPPRPGHNTDNREPVWTTAEAYAAKIAARADLLTSGSGIDLAHKIALHGRLSREMFAMEHSLAMDMIRSWPHEPLVDRERAARLTLAVAAYWTNRDELVGAGIPGAHPLLGLRPDDFVGSALYDFANYAGQAKEIADPAFKKIDLRVDVLDLTQVSSA